MFARLFLALLLVGLSVSLYTACNDDVNCNPDEFCKTWSGVGGPGYCQKLSRFTACKKHSDCAYGEVCSSGGDYCLTWEDAIILARQQ